MEFKGITVKELIEELSKFNPSAHVGVNINGKAIDIHGIYGWIGVDSDEERDINKEKSETAGVFLETEKSCSEAA